MLRGVLGAGDANSLWSEFDDRMRAEPARDQLVRPRRR
jgi:hypothetical protein